MSRFNYHYIIILWMQLAFLYFLNLNSVNHSGLNALFFGILPFLSNSQKLRRVLRTPPLLCSSKRVPQVSEICLHSNFLCIFKIHCVLVWYIFVLRISVSIRRQSFSNVVFFDTFCWFSTFVLQFPSISI